MKVGRDYGPVTITANRLTDVTVGLCRPDTDLADRKDQLSAEHAVLMPQHENLRVLLRLTAEQHRRGRQQLPSHFVQQGHGHLSMLSAWEGCAAVLW